ncbi:unnamed protein product [Cyprideis torosa]|uniref:Uncharacterized protein n=1 Tax=Cyprideis torosa TaxID=163714 RepID=A0A7R8ZQ06_9CRUS|nr:unnamed protein product [Cyprideis torosa]CAG0901815.1 unnamed protein product [Cyprideis torosa]
MVQEDLKHVRESYSKLRLINDKLKRDKEKQEKEREESTQILQNGLTKIHNEIRSIFQTPELKRQDGLQNECLRILEALEDLKRDAEPKPKPSRVIQHYRRTQSVIEERDEEAASPPHSPRYTARPTSNTLQPPMTKRSISFEDDEMRQLSSGGEKGSNSSLDHARYTAARGSREGSYDRVSVKSENIPGVVDSGRKSSGGMAAALKKKLSKLTKSKSIEDDLVVNPPDSKKGSISSSDLDITDDGDARGNRRESSGSVGGVAESKGGFFSRLRLRTPSPSQLLSRGRESRSPSVNRKRTETPSPERTTVSPALIGMAGSDKRTETPSPERTTVSPALIGMAGSDKRTETPSPERTTVSPALIGMAGNFPIFGGIQDSRPIQSTKHFKGAPGIFRRRDIRSRDVSWTHRQPTVDSEDRTEMMERIQVCKRFPQLPGFPQHNSSQEELSEEQIPEDMKGVKTNLWVTL